MKQTIRNVAFRSAKAAMLAPSERPPAKERFFRGAKCDIPTTTQGAKRIINPLWLQTVQEFRNWKNEEALTNFLQKASLPSFNSFPILSNRKGVGKTEKTPRTG
jgi:hypothetical protein